VVAASKRKREVEAKAKELLRELNELIQVRQVDRAGAEPLDPATILVKKGGESLKLIVTAPDQFSVEHFHGEAFTALSNVGEDDMRRAIVLWYCPELK
jgi:hypothetical protein